MPGHFTRRSEAFLRKSRQRLGEMQRFRSAAIWRLSHRHHPEHLGNRISCVMYHGVQASARKTLANQLHYMRNLGEFISTAEAVELLERGDEIDGRYFCITFDDGEHGAFANGFTMLAEEGIPGTFFIVPAWVSSDTAMDARSRKYVSWDECRQIVANGGTIGSHTRSDPMVGGASIVANPGFTDAGRGDFRLTSSSSLFAAGFRNLPFCLSEKTSCPTKTGVRSAITLNDNIR